jgi:hypothetical protein
VTTARLTCPPFFAEFVERKDAVKIASTVRTVTDLEAGKVTRMLI